MVEVIWETFLRISWMTTEHTFSQNVSAFDKFVLFFHQIHSVGKQWYGWPTDTYQFPNVLKDSLLEVELFGRKKVFKIMLQWRDCKLIPESQTNRHQFWPQTFCISIRRQLDHLNRSQQCHKHIDQVCRALDFSQWIRHYSQIVPMLEAPCHSICYQNLWHVMQFAICFGALRIFFFFKHIQASIHWLQISDTFNCFLAGGNICH